MESSAFRPGEYLTFRVARQQLAMEICWVRAILPADQLKPVDQPGIADPWWLIGHAVTGGQRFPVVDLRGRLNFPHGSHGKEPCILVIDVSAGDGYPQLAGFVADRVTEVIKARARDFRGGKLRLGRPRRVLQPEEVMAVEEVEAIA